MEKHYLAKLPVDLQVFVIGIEREAGIDIRVAVDDSRAGRHPGEPDPLACDIDEDGATILIPRADYFPDGSVLHKLLHINRLLVEQVPQINICDTHWDPQLETVFRQLDNNLEHLSFPGVGPRKVFDMTSDTIKLSLEMGSKLTFSKAKRAFF